MDKQCKRSFGIWYSKLSKQIKNCSVESTIYTGCIKLKGYNCNQYDCEKEFQSMIKCLNK